MGCCLGGATFEFGKDGWGMVRSGKQMSLNADIILLEMALLLWDALCVCSLVLIAYLIEAFLKGVERALVFCQRVCSSTSNCRLFAVPFRVTKTERRNDDDGLIAFLRPIRIRTSADLHGPDRDPENVDIVVDPEKGPHLSPFSSSIRFFQAMNSKSLTSR
jgi:hypothetical protein